MKLRTLPLALLAAACAASALPAAAANAASKEAVLFSFSGANGQWPKSRLIADSSGNLYGTTVAGGKLGYGVAFKLSPPAGGQTQWTETVLTSFTQATGATPYAGLIADTAGNFYGTTYERGKFNGGTVFKLSPPGVGKNNWRATALTSLSGIHGMDPFAGLLADTSGNLYGTTLYGGANHDGTVFELSPPAVGTTKWTTKVLASFPGTSPVLEFCEANVIADTKGDLYGTTNQGGDYGSGAVFELTPPAAGKKSWALGILFSFDGSNGGFPDSDLIIDGSGNLYGTTSGGGASNDGVVFKLMPPQNGATSWTENILFSFNGNNGYEPVGGLLKDTAGNLYGTTGGGGGSNLGTVFKLSPPSSGKIKWTKTTLVSFDGSNGQAPAADLIADAAGNLYGTTDYGGTYGLGTVFIVTP